MTNQCRLCLGHCAEDTLKDIFTYTIKQSRDTLVEILFWMFSVEIDVTDTYSKKICGDCITLVEYVVEIKNTFQRSQSQLRKSQQEVGESSQEQTETIEKDIPEPSAKKSLSSSVRVTLAALEVMCPTSVCIEKLETSPDIMGYKPIGNGTYKKRKYRHFKMDERLLNDICDSLDYKKKRKSDEMFKKDVGVGTSLDVASKATNTVTLTMVNGHPFIEVGLDDDLLDITENISESLISSKVDKESDWTDLTFKKDANTNTESQATITSKSIDMEPTVNSVEFGIQTEIIPFCKSIVINTRDELLDFHPDYFAEFGTQTKIMHVSKTIGVNTTDDVEFEGVRKSTPLCKTIGINATADSREFGLQTETFSCELKEFGTQTKMRQSLKHKGINATADSREFGLQTDTFSCELKEFGTQTKMKQSLKHKGINATVYSVESGTQTNRLLSKTIGTSTTFDSADCGTQTTRLLSKNKGINTRVDSVECGTQTNRLLSKHIGINTTIDSLERGTQTNLYLNADKKKKGIVQIDINNLDSFSPRVWLEPVEYLLGRDNYTEIYDFSYVKSEYVSRTPEESDLDNEAEESKESDFQYVNNQDKHRNDVGEMKKQRFLDYYNNFRPFAVRELIAGKKIRADSEMNPILEVSNVCSVFVCSFCSKSFSSEAYLNVHCSRAHKLYETNKTVNSEGNTQSDKRTVTSESVKLVNDKINIKKLHRKKRKCREDVGEASYVWNRKSLGTYSAMNMYKKHVENSESSRNASESCGNKKDVALNETIRKLVDRLDDTEFECDDE